MKLADPVFTGKSLDALFKEIHQVYKSRSNQIDACVGQIQSSLTQASQNTQIGVAELTMVMPLLKDLLGTAVRNDDQLIKLATLATKSSNEEEDAKDLANKLDISIEEQEDLLKKYDELTKPGKYQNT